MIQRLSSLQDKGFFAGPLIQQHPHAYTHHHEDYFFPPIYSQRFNQDFITPCTVLNPIFFSFLHKPSIIRSLTFLVGGLRFRPFLVWMDARFKWAYSTWHSLAWNYLVVYAATVLRWDYAGIIHYRFVRKVMLQGNRNLQLLEDAIMKSVKGSMQCSNLGQLPPAQSWIPRGTAATTHQKIGHLLFWVIVITTWLRVAGCSFCPSKSSKLYIV